MNLKSKLLAAIERVLQHREIKEVEAWDGSASNYADTDAYCAACLIDVNTAADRETKAQSHCMLPVRGPGDGRNVYVDKAVYAAAGGRGISQVERPDDVPEAAWNSAVRSAANALIDAYEQMDEVAPAGVFEAAGKDAPEAAERAISMENLWYQVYVLLNTATDEDSEYAQLVDVFVDGDTHYAIANQGGKLWRIPLMVNTAAAEVVLGEWEPVVIDFPAAQRLSVTRQADGRYRWTSVSCTAILNRVGEIDSTMLFDDFTARLAGGDPYPEVDINHCGATLTFGRADYVARDGVTLITSGLFYTDPLSIAVAEGLARDTESVWGTSIAYQPVSAPEILRVGDVTIPVYTAGQLQFVSIVREASAAALFTAIHTRSETMNDRIKADLLALTQREDLVAALEQRVDGINARTVQEQLISREVAPETVAEATPETAPEATAPAAVPPDVQAVQTLRETQRADHELLVQIRADLAQVAEALLDTEARLGALEVSEQQRARAWLNDLPAMSPVQSPPVRARNVSGEAQPTSADLAAQVLESIPGRY